jgi:hypothetical protein
MRSREPGAAGHDAEQCAGPDDPHQGKAAQPPFALDELHDRQLSDRDSGREHEPDQADPELADMRRVLRERRQQLAHHRDACADEDDVQDDVGQEDAIAHDVRVPPRVAVLLAMSRRRQELQHAGEHEKRDRVEQEEQRERARVCGAGDRAGDERAESEPNVHRHPLLREGRVTARGRRQRAE